MDRRDVAQRVSRMSPGSTKELKFTQALHGYFNAMPFQRGSGAIGRIYFSVLYRHLFGKTLTLAPDIDVRAMVMTPMQLRRQLFVMPGAKLSRDK